MLMLDPNHLISKLRRVGEKFEIARGFSRFSGMATKILSQRYRSELRISRLSTKSIAANASPTQGKLW